MTIISAEICCNKVWYSGGNGDNYNVNCEINIGRGATDGLVSSELKDIKLKNISSVLIGQINNNFYNINLKF